jgi:anti-anti-sigma factor
MDLKIRQRNNITIIDIEGNEIDHKNTSLLSEKISDLIKEESIQNIALNLENISWLTSSGIGTLLNIRKHLNKLDGELCLFNINPQVLDSIKVLMIDRILPVFPGEDEAVEYLKTTPWSKSEKIFEVIEHDDIRIIEIKEKQVDLQNSGEIESKCIELIENEGIKKLGLDFTNVTFITSSGIGTLLSIYNCSNNNNASMCLFNINRDIQEALEISMVDKILNIESSKDDAIRHLNESASQI